MRFKKLSLVPVLAAAASLVIFVGCSGDETVVDPVVNQITDPQFPAVQAQVNAFVDSTLSLYGTGFSLTASTTTTDIERALFGPDPADSTKSANFWTTLYLADFGAGTSNILIDSVQYFDASNQPQIIGAGASSLNLRHQWTKTNTDISVSHENYDVNSNLTFGGLSGMEATVNGTYSMVLRAKVVTVDSIVTRDFTIAAGINNLTFSKSGGNWASNCPLTGSITVIVDMDYQKDLAAMQTSNWIFTVNFTDGVGNVSVSHSNESDSYSQPFCTP